MDQQNIIEILDLQSKLGRTKNGWILGKGMIGASSGSIAAIQQNDLLIQECLNCEIVLSAELFSAGCPNCGSKDHNRVQVAV